MSREDLWHRIVARRLMDSPSTHVQFSVTVDDRVRDATKRLAEQERHTRRSFALLGVACLLNAAACILIGVGLLA